MNTLLLLCLLTIANISLSTICAEQSPFGAELCSSSESTSRITLPVLDIALKLTDDEIFTKQTFKELINNTKEQNRMWILGVCHNQSATPGFYSAIELERWRTFQDLDPNTDLPITSVDYYGFKSENDRIILHYFGNNILRISKDGFDYHLQGKLNIARKFLQAAATLGDTTAMLNLGYSYKEEKPKEALKWFQEAAKKGNPRALIEASSLLYEDKTDIAIDYLKLAITKLKDLDNEGDELTSARINLAFIYRQTGNINQAIADYLEIAQDGYVSPDMFYALSLTNDSQIDAALLTRYANIVIDNINKNDSYTVTYKQSDFRRFQVVLAMVRQYATTALFFDYYGDPKKRKRDKPDDDCSKKRSCRQEYSTDY